MAFNIGMEEERIFLFGILLKKNRRQNLRLCKRKNKKIFVQHGHFVSIYERILSTLCSQPSMTEFSINKFKTNHLPLKGALTETLLK